MAPRITLSQIEAFRVVAKTSSHTRAAEILGYSEAAICQQIRALERCLQVKLFSVHRHRLQLTPIGIELASLAEPVTAGVEKFQAVATMFRHENAHDIILAAPSSTSSFLLRHVLPGILDEYPNVKLEVTSSSRLVIRELLKGSCHIGIVNAAPLSTGTASEFPSDLIATPWLSDCMLVVRSPVRRAAPRPECSATRRIFYPAARDETEVAWISLLTSAPFGDKVECVPVASNEDAKSAAIGGLGEALLPGRNVVDELQMGLLERVPFPEVRRQLMVATLRRQPAPIRAVLDLLMGWRDLDILATTESTRSGPTTPVRES